MQEQVTEFVSKYGLKADAQSRYIDFMSEAGQLGQAILQASDYGSRPLYVTDEIAAKAGDTLFSFFAMISDFGLDAQDILDAVMASYQARLSEISHEK